MNNSYNHDDVRFSYELGDWFDWEIDDGEIALTRDGGVKLNGKVLSGDMVTFAAKHSWAFKDAVRKWRLKAEELTCESPEEMTDARALCELEQAQRIINKHIDQKFVMDFCQDQLGYFGFSYCPKRYAEIAANEAAA